MVVLLASVPQAGHAQLLITGVFDGPIPGGVPKGVELLAVDDIPDLGIFAVGSANNGGGSDGEEFSFPADSARAGDFLYVASEEIEFGNYFGFDPDYVSAAMLINGDDAIELFRDAEVVDVFGDIDVDGSGQPWEYLDGWAYRKDGSGPSGAAFVLDEWFFSGPDALDNETENGTARSPVPIGSYARGRDAVPLQAGDADQDLDFDQSDLVKVQIAGKYLTGQPATWGEGDWDAAPGGAPGRPPLGNGLFDQLDIVAALNAAVYLNGPYSAIGPRGQMGDDLTLSSAIALSDLTVVGPQSGGGDLGHVHLVHVPVPEPSTAAQLGLAVTIMLSTWICRGLRPIKRRRRPAWHRRL